MPIDPAHLLAMPPIPARQAWSVRDTMIYALGIGASELDFVYEDGLKPLPMMCCVLGYPGFIWQKPEFGMTWQKIVHAEQAIEIHGAVPVEGTITADTIVERIVDKGAAKGALITTSRRILDGDGNHFATVRSTSIARGDGGFGGDSSAPPPTAMPDDRAPDITLSLPTADTQALLYRLSGDYNPLHIDPAVARTGGFERPILHGMCTYGVAGRALIASLCANDPTRLVSMACRFSAPVYPGETIRTEIWNDASGKARFRARVEERDVIVLNNGSVEFR
jgi:acyl dehydratase